MQVSNNMSELVSLRLPGVSIEGLLQKLTAHVDFVQTTETIGEEIYTKLTFRQTARSK